MENMGIEKLTEELKRINPGIIIFARAEFCQGTIIANCDDVTELKFPEGYYFNGKNKLTNKHNTASGQYESFELMDMYHYFAMLA